MARLARQLTIASGGAVPRPQISNPYLHAMRRINIEQIKLYAYHGCLDEEARIGGNYIVDVSLDVDFSVAEKTDDLTRTVDYCAVYEVCRAEMEIRSKLIEHVCARIHNRLMTRFPSVTWLKVKLTKMNPPIGGNVGNVSVEISSGLPGVGGD
jgi:dihydroneopterin aldolase